MADRADDHQAHLELDDVRHLEAAHRFTPPMVDGRARPDVVVTRFAGDSEDLVAPLRYGEDVVLLVRGRVRGVSVAERITADADHLVRTQGVKVEHLAVLDDDVLEPLGLRVADVIDHAGAAQVRDRAVRDGHDVLPLPEYVHRQRTMRDPGATP